MNERNVQRILQSVATSDGAGVRLRRSLGHNGERLDPFLMLDEFGTDRPEDYIAGFPSHPHRGFETVTYMLNGRMRHEDHLGNVGELSEGGVQWMTAGRGVIHSEMPAQEQGRMRGFQLWINLPAAEKMKPAGYKDIPVEEIPVAQRSGAEIKVIAGEVDGDNGLVRGPIFGLTTQPTLLDVALVTDAQIQLALPSSHNAMVYVFEGLMAVGADRRQIAAGNGAILGPGDVLSMQAAGGAARALVLAGQPLDEPVVQYGPFVMNTREEIEQALADYRRGELTG